MGNSFSKVFGRFLSVKDVRVLMLGLDAAGKTTILENLKGAKPETNVVIPTVGFNVETIRRGNMRFSMWDVGGQKNIRPLWRHYYSGTQGLIFVVDSDDRKRLPEARDELNRIMQDPELVNCQLLVFANKQDIQSCMSVDEVIDGLQLQNIKNNWHVLPSNAKKGEGIEEGLQWLHSNIDDENKR